MHESTQASARYVLAARPRPRSYPLLTPVAPAQTWDQEQRFPRKVQDDPYIQDDPHKKKMDQLEKEHIRKREVCARCPPAPAFLPAADSRRATFCSALP